MEAAAAHLVSSDAQQQLEDMEIRKQSMVGEICGLQAELDETTAMLLAEQAPATPFFTASLSVPMP